MTERFVFSKIDVGKQRALVFYDLKNMSVVEEVTSYGEALDADLQLEPISIEHELGHLRIFWTFLANSHISLHQVDDAVLKRFRNFALAAVKRNPSHRQSADSANRTVNEKLVRIYDWLLWLREGGLVPADAIGQGAKVRTALSHSSARAVSFERRELPPLAKYPLLLRLKAGKSKHRLPKAVPTEETVDRLFQHFHDATKLPFLAERNCLLVEIPSETAFRRGSLQSLTVDQFVGPTVVRTKADTIVVQPSRQKFGYANAFEIPYLLHVNVVRFVERFWKPYVKERGIPAKVHQQHLFISASTGAPLRDRTITAIVSEAMRAAGFPKGTAVHSFRSKAAVERMMDEYEDRAAAGLSTNPDAIDRALAKAMGWSNPESARPYTSSYEASQVAAKRARRLQSTAADKDRIKELEQLVRTLRRDSEGEE